MSMNHFPFIKNYEDKLKFWLIHYANCSEFRFDELVTRDYKHNVTIWIRGYLFGCYTAVDLDDAREYASIHALQNLNALVQSLANKLA